MAFRLRLRPAAFRLHLREDHHHQNRQNRQKEENSRHHYRQDQSPQCSEEELDHHSLHRVPLVYSARWVHSARSLPVLPVL